MYVCMCLLFQKMHLCAVYIYMCIHTCMYLDIIQVRVTLAINCSELLLIDLLYCFILLASLPHLISCKNRYQPTFLEECVYKDIHILAHSKLCTYMYVQLLVLFIFYFNLSYFLLHLFASSFRFLVKV